MRIVVVVSEFPKVTETFAVSNILHYMAAGHDVSLFHNKRFRSQEIIHDEARPVVERAFTFPWLWGPSLAALAHVIASRPVKFAILVAHFFRAFWREPRRLAASLAILPKASALGRYAKEKGVDHIHAEFASHPATTAWIAHRLFGIQFSFSAHMHDIFVSQSLLAEKSCDASFARTISAFNIRKLQGVPGFDSKKIKLVRCGVDLGRFAYIPRDPADAEKQFDILFVGSLFARKGCALLLEAMKQIGSDWPWHLTIIGDGPERDTIAEIAKALPKGRVTMEGAQASDAVQRAMARAHLFVLPSFEVQGGRSEGIPVVLMEAMASGCPVISSRISGIPELIEDGVTGILIDAKDVDGLARAIVGVRENFASALKRSHAARERVEAEYDIARNAHDLLELMEAACCSQPHSG